ncbi:hypothetical protein D8S78_13045 [Natrialba swarupiae]|nr:hypothetical protein [Natrialba swarupiae]
MAFVPGPRQVEIRPEIADTGCDDQLSADRPPFSINRHRLIPVRTTHRLLSRFSLKTNSGGRCLRRLESQSN